MGKALDRRSGPVARAPRGGLLQGLRGGGEGLGAGEVGEAPAGEGDEDVAQGLAGGGELVVEASAVLLIGGLGDEALLVEVLEAVGEDVGGDAFGGGEEFIEALLAEEEIAHDEDGPAVAEEVERARDRAGGAAGRAFRFRGHAGK